MSQMYGADAQALVEGAQRLRRAADDLDGHARELNSTVSGLGWLGPIANAFVSLWNGGHRRNLAAAAASFREAADVLERNAADQARASDGATGAAVAPRPVAGAAPGPATPAGGGGSTPPTGWTPGSTPNSNRSWQEVQRDYDANYAKFGLWADGGPNGENRYQCVSWAWYRMRELGFSGAQVQGNGADVAGRLGGTTTTVPEPGAVMSYGTGWGHVVIAEEIARTADGRLRIRVSEMNVEGDYAVGRPEEYRSDRWIEQNPDGTWSSGNRNHGAVTVFNPDYP